MEELLHDLHIEPGALLVNIVSFVLLIYLMRRFLFGPIGVFIENRKRRIAQELDQAEEERRQAEGERLDLQGRGDEILQAAENTASLVLREAEQEAAATRQEARDAARVKERAARASIEKDTQEAAAALRDKTSAAAAVMARRLLTEALDEDRHRALLDEFIADVEALAEDRPRSS